MEYVSRQAWDAREPKLRPDLPGPVKGLAVHWEGPDLGQFAHTQCDDKVRGIQRFHMDTRRWVDIAYNWVVCPHGFIFEGRGWGVRSSAQGTETGNRYYHAACYLGGEGNPFTALAKLAYEGLVEESRRRYPEGQEVRPHNYFHSTQCPGPDIDAWLETDPFRAVPVPVPEPEEAPPVATYIAWNPGNSFLVDNNTKVYVGGELAAVRELGKKLYPPDGFVEQTFSEAFVSRIPDAA